MFARKIVPAIPASQSRDDGPDARYSNPFPLGSVPPLVAALDLNARLRDLETKLARWHADREDERNEQLNDARADAEYDAMLAREAEELAAAVEAGECDADGEPVPFDRYYGGVR